MSFEFTQLEVWPEKKNNRAYLQLHALLNLANVSEICTHSTSDPRTTSFVGQVITLWN